MVKNLSTTKTREPSKGIVTDCSLLYVRRQPNSTSDVCVIIPALTEVVIDPDFISDTHYRVVIPSLLRRTKFADFNFDKNYHGYCDKKFISLKG